MAIRSSLVTGLIHSKLQSLPRRLQGGYEEIRSGRQWSIVEFTKKEKKKEKTQQSKLSFLRKKRKPNIVFYMLAYGCFHTPRDAARYCDQKWANSLSNQATGQQ